MDALVCFMSVQLFGTGVSLRVVAIGITMLLTGWNLLLALQIVLTKGSGKNGSTIAVCCSVLALTHLLAIPLFFSFSGHQCTLSSYPLANPCCHGICIWVFLSL